MIHKLQLLFTANLALYSMPYSSGIAGGGANDVIYAPINAIDGWANPNPTYQSCFGTVEMVNTWYLLVLPYTTEVETLAVQNNELSAGNACKYKLYNQHANLDQQYSI